MAVLFWGLISLVGFDCRAQNAPTEYQVKAAFIYNFARFVDWPTQAFADAASPMVIGVLGKNVFGDNLAQILKGNSVRGHPLQFKAFDSATDAVHCQVLFISASEKNHLSKILGQFRGKSILTVGETDNFIGDGGMINLKIVNNKVRFEINNTVAQQAGLTISSKLLSLAISVQ